MISEYDYTIELRPSKSMKITDCLSRQFVELNALQITKRNLAELQTADPILNLVRNYVTTDRWPNHPDDDFKPFLQKRHYLVFGRDGELLLKENVGVRTIPAQIMVVDIIKTYHDKNGHPGEQQCIRQLSRNYFWPNMTKDVKEYIKSCHDCQTNKPNLHPRHPPMGRFETPNGPWEFLSFDLIGPLTITEDGNRYAIVGTDTFSKKVYAAAIPTKDSHIVTNEIKRILRSLPKKPMLF